MTYLFWWNMCLATSGNLVQVFKNFFNPVLGPGIFGNWSMRWNELRFWQTIPSSIFTICRQNFATEFASQELNRRQCILRELGMLFQWNLSPKCTLRKYCVAIKATKPKPPENLESLAEASIGCSKNLATSPSCLAKGLASLSPWLRR